MTSPHAPGAPAAPGVLLHGCDPLAQEALAVALRSAVGPTDVWDPALPACRPDRPLLVLAGPVAGGSCRSGCSRCLAHWRAEHRLWPVVLVGHEGASPDDWSLEWRDDLDHLLDCLEQAAAGRRPGPVQARP